MGLVNIFLPYLGARRSLELTQLSYYSMQHACQLEVSRVSLSLSVQITVPWQSEVMGSNTLEETGFSLSYASDALNLSSLFYIFTSESSRFVHYYGYMAHTDAPLVSEERCFQTNFKNRQLNKLIRF